LAEGKKKAIVSLSSQKGGGERSELVCTGRTNLKAGGRIHQEKRSLQDRFPTEGKKGCRRGTRKSGKRGKRFGLRSTKISFLQSVGESSQYLDRRGGKKRREENSTL